MQFLTDRSNFGGVKFDNLKVFLAHENAGGGGQAGAERELFSRLNLEARVFLAALAYELSFALRFTEGDLDLESTGETSRMLSNRLTDRKELFLAKLAEESLK